MGISELSKRRNFSELVRISFWEKSNNLRFVYIANTIFIYFLIEYSNYYLLFTSSIRKKNTHTLFTISHEDFAIFENELLHTTLGFGY